MPPKRIRDLDSGLSSRHSKKVKTNPDEVKVYNVTNDDYTDKMKAMEETLKKKMYDDLVSTQLQVLKTVACLQQQSRKSEAALDEAKKMFKTYDDDIKTKDDTIQTLKAEIESIKNKGLEAENKAETIKTLKAEIKSLSNKNFEEEFRANQVEDNMEILRQQMKVLEEEKTKVEEEIKTSKEAVKNLDSDKESLLRENQNLNIEIKTLKDDSRLNSEAKNRIESLEHEVETEAEEKRLVMKDLEKYQAKCENLRTQYEEKSKETVELQMKSKEREEALSKCQKDFMKIELQINEFLKIKEAKEKEFSGTQAKYAELLKKYKDLQKSNSEELSLMNKKFEESQKTVKENKVLIDQLRSEGSDHRAKKLEDKVTALKRDLASLTSENKEANKAKLEKEKEVKLAEGKLLRLETERREDREKAKSLEEKLKERDIEREKLQRELKDSSKRLQRKKDLLKKIEKKSHERKLKLKRYQEATYSDKANKDITKKDKKKVLTLKCLKLVLNGEENSAEQIKFGKLTPSGKQKDEVREIEDYEEKSNHLDYKTSNKKASGMRIDTSIPACDELLAESEDEQDKVHNDKDLNPSDVNLTCDDVIDTIVDQSAPPSFEAGVDLNETDELLKIQEFLENTEIVGNLIEDIISIAVLPLQDQFSISGGISKKISAEKASEETSQLSGSQTGLHQFYCNIRNAVRQSLLKYYQQEGVGAQFRIMDDKHFTELCRKFSHEFREELRDSYIGEPEGGILSEADKLYISKQIDTSLSSI